MKKILFLLLTIFTFIGVINAEEYYFNFKTKDSYGYITANTMYKNGYVFTDTGYGDEDDLTYIAYYESDNKLIKSNIISGVEIHYLTADDEFIYALGYKESDRNYYIYKLNENLEVVKSKNISDYYWPIFEKYGYANYRLGTGVEYLMVEDGTIKIFNYDPPKSNVVYPYIVTTMNTNLENIKTTHIFSSDYFQNFKLALEKLYPIIDEESYDYAFTEPIMLGEDILLSSSKWEGVCLDSAPIGSSELEPKLLADKPCQIVARLTLFDENGQEIWNKEIANYSYLENLRVTQKYIIAIAHQAKTYSSDYYGSDILIMDHEGNILQTIMGSNGISRLEADDKSLVFTSYRGSACDEAFPFDEEYCINKNQHEVYLLEYKIDTKVTKGKGKVEAIKSSKPGEPVTFVVTPDPGYVLGEVRVTDATGKTVIFKQNVFTMPTADVMIEAEFLPINPETKDLAIALIIMLSIVTLVITIVEGKKLKFLGV